MGTFLINSLEMGTFLIFGPKIRNVPIYSTMHLCSVAVCIILIQIKIFATPKVIDI